MGLPLRDPLARWHLSRRRYFVLCLPVRDLTQSCFGELHAICEDVAKFYMVPTGCRAMDLSMDLSRHKLRYLYKYRSVEGAERILT